MTILDDRLAELDTISLAEGSHWDRGEGMCAMEAVAWLAGEDHTDRPVCVSGVLAVYVSGLNDMWDDEKRQTLKGFLPRLVGTNTGPDDEQKRGFVAADWLIRTYTPAWLRFGGFDAAADRLAGLPPVLSWPMVEACLPVLWEASDEAAPSGYASVHAWDAYPAYPAWDAFRHAADTGGATHAYWTAGDVWDACRSTVLSAASRSQFDRAPMVAVLEASAIDLLDRMIEVGR